MTIDTLMSGAKSFFSYISDVALSNESNDIRKLFTETMEKLGLSWTTANQRNVAISRREDVELLDKYVGAKV